MLELHRASFVEWQPAAVVAVKATSSFHGGKCVALARENGDMEMYDAHSWRLIGRVPGKDGDSITRLEWLQPLRVDGAVDEERDDDGAAEAVSETDQIAVPLMQCPHRGNEGGALPKLHVVDAV